MKQNVTVSLDQHTLHKAKNLAANAGLFRLRTKRNWDFGTLWLWLRRARVERSTFSRKT
jgi:hypothetical protein